MNDKLKQEFEALVDDIGEDDEGEVKAGFSWAVARLKARGAAKDLLRGVETLWQMLTDPDYVMSWQTKAWIIAALCYLISPVDALPDAVPVLGYVDDALLIAWVMHQISGEVVRYRAARP